MFGIGVIVGLLAAFLTARLLGEVRVFSILDSLPPVCPVKRVLGLKCAFCGMTHAFFHLFFGEWREAVHENLLSIPVFVAAILLPVRGAPGRLLAWGAIGVLFVYAIARNFL
ncbi:MAG: DUF2752 domain-containing protein [Proteobacteria bacterium]|nr:DUF2752 domain-containing protein [Pseudomonadota bacterium]